MSLTKFPIHQYHDFKSLPLDQLKDLKYSIFVIDYEWKYLFLNTYSTERLKGITVFEKRVQDIWKDHPEFNFQPLFNLINPGVRMREAIEIKSKSPVTNKAIEISGYPLEDCYYFSVIELPDKDSLIAELKRILKR